MAFFLVTLNTACRWSKRSTKKNILSIDKVVAFEASSKFWGMKEWRKRCKENTRLTRIKAFPVGVDVVAWYYFSINFCAFSSSWCCIIVASSPSLMIICSFSSRFCTSSFSSRSSVLASWASLGELIHYFFGTYLFQFFFDCQFRKFVLLVLQQCSKGCVVIGSTLKPFIYRWPYMGVLNVWIDIGMFHWPRRWIDGAQCKYKCWFMFKAFL